MKKISRLLFVGLLASALSFPVLAKQTNGKPSDKNANGAMMGKNMMDSNRMGMNQKPMMANGTWRTNRRQMTMDRRHMLAAMMLMAKKSMVATSDGGIVVLCGNKLQKFDRDLNFVKETELKIDMTAMKKMMEQSTAKMNGEESAAQ